MKRKDSNCVGISSDQGEAAAASSLSELYYNKTVKYFVQFRAKVCSINFEPSDIDLCSACHVYPISRGAWIISILFMLNRFTWGLN